MTKLEQLISHMPEDIDAVLITSPYNRLYYTGLQSSAGTLLVMRSAVYFIIDFRYIEVAQARVRDCTVIEQENLGEQLKKYINMHGVHRIGVESDYCTIGAYLMYRTMLPDCEIIQDNRITEIIQLQRMQKDENELAFIRQAQKYTDESFKYICNYIKPGMSERQVALELEMYSRKLGSEGPSFDFIVVAGSNTSMPHGVPGDYIIQNGDFVTMDFGCKVNGYCSDMTRTIAVGKVSEEMEKVYQTVLRANVESMAAIRAGKPCAGIDKIARDIIEDAGYAGCFGHGLGHSLGIEIHEEPRFSPSDKNVCKSGMIMTVEPGIYISGRFGCRIEDMVYITENGCINLTNSNKELTIL